MKRYFQTQLFNFAAKHYIATYVCCTREASGVKMQYDAVIQEPFWVFFGEEDRSWKHLLPIFLFLLEEDCCWAIICANLPLLCMWDTATTSLDEQCVCLCPGSEPMNPGLPEQSVLNLTTMPPGQPPKVFLRGNFRIRSGSWEMIKLSNIQWTA